MNSSTSNIIIAYKVVTIMKYWKKIVVRILETEASKNKLFYRCNDRSSDNTFIDWCKLINENELTMKEFTCVNDIKLTT
jgi:hypothetical protein